MFPTVKKYMHYCLLSYYMVINCGGMFVVIAIGELEPKIRNNNKNVC
jgi:hypothetical protein